MLKHPLLWTFVFLFLALHCHREVLACHKGGKMGFARRNPTHFTIDLTMSPTFVVASTSGTSNCDNWDLYGEQRKYAMQNWESLSEEAAQGQGPHLLAFGQMLQCSRSGRRRLASAMQSHYDHLFIKKNDQPLDIKAEHILHSLHELIISTPQLQEECSSASISI